MACNMVDPISNVGARQDWRIRQGADFLATLNFTNADGTPYDLTNQTASAQIRKLPGDAIAAAVFTCLIPAPASGGVLELQLAASAAASLPCGLTWNEPLSMYYWDLELLNTATNLIWSPMYGTVQVFREITKP